MKKEKTRFPFLLRVLLFFILPYNEHYNLSGDFEELYNIKKKILPGIKAAFWTTAQLIISAPGFLKNKIYWGIIMLLHYIKTAFRFLGKNKAHSLINISGLGLGIACCILLFMYVYEETNYDNFYPDNDRIYRVIEEIATSSDVRTYVPIAYPVGPALAEKHPQIEKTVRVDPWGTKLVKYENKQFYEDRVKIADQNFIEVFQPEFLLGDPQTALTRPNTILLTRKASEKYFGNDNPLAKVLKINNSDFEVTGVIENCPTNTHLKYDFLYSFATLADHHELQNWYGTGCYTYIKLKPNVNVEHFQEEMKTIIHDFIDNDLVNWGETRYCYLQPIKDIHLKSDYLYELDPPGDISTVVLLAALGFLVLIIACMNFINLTTAKSLTRAKEIGVRKVIGSDKKQLISQFFGETFVLTSLSVIFAIIFIMLALPTFNEISGKSFDIMSLLEPTVIGAVILTALLVGFFSGLYPALFLSSFKPVATLKGLKDKNAKGSLVRSVMVVFQFAISIFLIIGTTVIYNQINFMKDQHPGFNKEQKLVIPFRGGASLRNDDPLFFREIKNEFKNHHAISGATVTSSVPGRTLSNFAIEVVGKVKETGQGMYHLFYDHDFINEYEIEIIAGRNYDIARPTDVTKRGDEGKFILNKSAADALGFANPKDAIGQTLKTGNGGRPGVVIGVTDDFNFNGFRDKVDPLVMEYFPHYFRYLTLTTSVESINEVLDYLQSRWSERFADVPFEYFFLDEEFAALYKAEERLGTISSIFTFIGIFIACLGLFSLASFAAARRTKEMGIRKVLGAPVGKLVYLLSKDFFVKVLLANVLAWPIAYIVLNNWLQDFAYRIDVSIWTFIVSGLIALVIAALTVIYRVFRAANANPVDSLRYE
ncbi:ABC transporter permease [Bacteroidota bacterium]